MVRTWDRYSAKGHYLQTDKCKNPKLDVERRRQEFLDRKFLRCHIISVLVDTTDYEIAFLYVEELPGFMGVIREIDEKEVCKERGYACNLWFACISIRVLSV